MYQLIVLVAGVLISLCATRVTREREGQMLSAGYDGSLMRTIGIAVMPAAELHFASGRTASLRDVLAHLAGGYSGKLKGAWLLVAP